MSLDFFSPALAPATRPEFDAEPEPCTSVYWLPPDPERRGPQSLRCPLDADHRHDQSDARHGRGLTRWTSAEAARSLADFGPRPAAGPFCDSCGFRPAAGLCGVCSHAEQARDERETESEDAA